MAGRNEDAESDDDDDSFEVLDLAECARGQQWWSGVFGTDCRCAGYLFQRVGKVAITVFGGGFLLLQAANHSGYGKIDWKRVGKDVTEAKKHLKKRVDTAAPGIKAYIQESTAFVKRNVVLSGGFAGGFLLGLAS